MIVIDRSHIKHATNQANNDTQGGFERVSRQWTHDQMHPEDRAALGCLDLRVAYEADNLDRRRDQP